jgi:hypothetical protein
LKSGCEKILVDVVSIQTLDFVYDSDDWDELLTFRNRRFRVWYKPKVAAAAAAASLNVVGSK